MSKKLAPGEECMFCGSIGHADNLCSICEKPFTHKTPWRLYRGKRIHKSCSPTKPAEPCNPSQSKP